MADVPIPSPPTLFGLKVSTASASMGWGGQGGSCSLSLVDEGTVPALPPNGTACGFIFDKFEFGGHLQRWNYKESLSGRFYDVNLESPAKLLDGVQVILSEFETGYNIYGGRNELTNQVSNVWNPFAQLESFSYGGVFGGSHSDASGFPVYKLFPQLALFGQGVQNYQRGKIRFGNSDYTIDFSELESYVLARAPYYRVKGPVQSINGLLQDLAEVAQVDYFVQLRADNNGVITDPHLIVRTADRGTVASGVVQSYVNSVKGLGIVVSDTVGQELQDVATTKVLIGGPASRYYDAPVANSMSCIPVWGKFSNSDYLGYGITPITYNDLNATVPVIVNEFSPVASYNATIFELRMALGGMQTWETFKVFQIMSGTEPNGFTTTNHPFIGAMEANEKTLKGIAGLIGGKSRDAVDMAVTSAKRANKAYQAYAKEQAQGFFAGVSKVASNFYGQVFMVPLPMEPGGIDNNLRWIQYPYSYEASWEISESAWPTTFPTNDFNFYDGEGRLRSASTFPNSASIDYSPLGGDYAKTLTLGEIATTKGGPDKDTFWLNGTPWCIVRAGAQLRNYDAITTPDFGLSWLILNFFPSIGWVNPNLYMGPGKQSIQISIPPAVVPPSIVGVPQESTRYTWGPWYAFSADNGKAEVEVDSSMKPETYGGVTAMDAVGFGSVFSGVARIEAVESGSVELALAPQFNMGERFASSGPYVTSLDISIGVDGYKTNYKFSTWTPNFGKLAKYNADRLAKVNKAGISFAKEQRGRISKQPFPKFKFEKTDFSAKKAGGGKRFDNNKGMELFNGMFKTI